MSGAPRDGMPWREVEGFVFVITYGRTGSTVLLNLLNSIDGYCIRGENNNTLFPLYQSWEALAKSVNLQGLRKRGRETTSEEPWYGGELSRPRPYRTALMRAFCDEVLAIPKGTKVAGFKEIRHPREEAPFVGYMEFILSAFPNAKIIFNSRRLSDVVRSGMHADQPPEAVTKRLAKSDRLFADFQASHPRRCFSLRYEDWVGQPEAFAPLYAFLGMPFDANQVARVLDTKLTHMQHKGRNA